MIYSFGPFRLVPDERRLERDGVPLTITPKAFDLLVALVRHRTRALSKDEMLALVWPGITVEEGNLTQQVFLIRRTLDDDAGQYIATLPRHGYRFVGAVTEEAGPVRPRVSQHCLAWDGREFALSEGASVIGRGDDADVRIPLPSLSRRHARVIVDGDECRLSDLGSRHGTWRAGVRVDGEVRLHSGDELALGTARLVYTAVLPTDTTRA